MYGKIIKVEFGNRKITLKSNNILHHLSKLALSSLKSGTFNSQNWHFYQPKVALFWSKIRRFYMFFNVFYCTLFIKTL